MPRWLSILLQLVGGAGQVANVFMPAMDPQTKIITAGCIAAGQLVVNALAHNSNPDGTPAEVAWVPKKK